METNKEFKTWFRSFSNNGKGFYIFSKIERMMGMYWLNITENVLLLKLWFFKIRYFLSSKYKVIMLFVDPVIRIIKILA